MKIKLDNMDAGDEDPCVLITTLDRQGAIDDQSIAGSRWEAPGDLYIAYAMPVDHPGLVKELIADGYDLDLTDYCPPD